MMKVQQFVTLLVIVIAFSCNNKFEKSPPIQKKFNVLFIAVDDLRPELHCYGQSQIISPNIDRLASQSLLFKRAYVQQAVCAPSRNGVMTGLRPDAIGIYNLGTFFRDSVPDVVTLPQHFKNNGYQAESMGKIYHLWHGNHDDSISWSTDSWFPRNELLDAQPITRGDTTGLEASYPSIGGERLPYYATDAPEDQLEDTRTLKYALERLDSLQDTTFFMAVGFMKPHLPFVAPRRFWDMYDSSVVSIPERVSPQGSPGYALNSFGELRKYYGIPAEGYLSDETTKSLIHGYYASVTYVDDLVGQLLNKLDALNLSENTIVVLWGDHGWKLGEYGDWCKHTNYEYDTRIPMLLKVPGETTGSKTDALVESIDIYPTLCELAGLDKPAHLQGVSMVPLMDNPDQTIKNTAWSQYPRNVDSKPLMGYAMRTNQYRYVRWQEKNNANKVIDRELYDHVNDPGETINLASFSENQTLVEQMDSVFLAEFEISHHDNMILQ